MGSNKMYNKGGEKGAKALKAALTNAGYQTGGSTYGAGNGDMTPGRERMQAMAKGGGLMGYMNGGDVLDANTMSYGGTIK